MGDPATPEKARHARALTGFPRQRRHVSFSGVIIPAALIAVATLSVVTVLAGMRFVAPP